MRARAHKICTARSNASAGVYRLPDPRERRSPSSTDASTLLVAESGCRVGLRWTSLEGADDLALESVQPPCGGGGGGGDDRP